ncbi:MAG: hypothetical protein IJQ80_07595, partial [Clostridia bacterium]|nr:hypothetical protein [Clostridia bacterium]
REAIANDLNFVETYELDITGQTLGQINTPGTYQNVGYRANEQDVFHPFSASWPGAGYTVTPNVENYNATHSLIVFATYDNCIKIADCVDLSKYNSVTITYGTDQSFGTNQNGAALNSAFGLFSTKTVYGHTGGNNHNENGIICYLNPTAADGTSPSWVTTRTVSKAINSNYVGPLWMSFYHNTGDGAVVTNISFHLKTAVAETIDTTNNQAGSTVYKVSGDGSTISANGKTYENNVNMTNGVTVATDDVRTLRTDRTTENDLPATNGVRGGYDFANKNVGVFYFIWLGAHGKDLYDIQARVNANSLSNRYLTGAAATDDTKTDALWGPGQVHQFFSEPMYGYYYSSDEWVIRRHIEELTNADVDFIFFDVTNGIPYIQNAVKVMQVIHEFNLMGYNPPKVVFYSNDNNSSGTGNITMLQYLWNNIYSQNVYPDTWFCYQGKPVIIGKQIYFNQLSAAIQNFFTFRQSQWPNETNRSRIEGDQTIHYSETDANGYAISDGQGSTYYKKNGGWSWMDFSDLPNPNKYPNGNGYESINVSVAQHLGTVAFGDSGIYDQHCHKNSGKFIFGTGRYNHGRNWRGSSITNDDTGENYKQGYNFQRQWDTVHNTYSDDLPVVLVTGWNEWAAGRQAGAPRTGAHMAWFVDTATVNYSRDIEMTKGYYFDSYYMQLIDNIRKYKGSAPTLVRDQMKRIDVYGSFDQWNDVTTSYRDPTGDQAARNTTGFSNTPYVNNTGRNDLKSCKIVHDTEYIYFYAECASNITPFSAATPWMKIYIDIDQDKSTGWNGYDYAVNYEATGANTTSVASYSSNGTASYVDRNISYSVNGTMIMIKVPLSDLGISDYTNIDFAFKWVDSTTSITTMEQLYTYGDQMPHGRLNFVFTNH